MISTLWTLSFPGVNIVITFSDYKVDLNILRKTGRQRIQVSRNKRKPGGNVGLTHDHIKLMHLERQRAIK